jgi:hypothetical protein
VSRSPLVDALVALAVSLAVLFGASWVIERFNDTPTVQPVAGIDSVACDIVVNLTGWHPGFPCWWLLAGALVIVWGLVFGVARSR